MVDFDVLESGGIAVDQEMLGGFMISILAESARGFAEANWVSVEKPSFARLAGRPFIRELARVSGKSTPCLCEGAGEKKPEHLARFIENWYKPYGFKRRAPCRSRPNASTHRP